MAKLYPIGVNKETGQRQVFDPEVDTFAGELFSEIEEHFNGEIAPNNANTVLTHLLSVSPADPLTVDMWVNGIRRTNGEHFSVGGPENRVITWLGSVPPGTGTNNYDLDATDDIDISYFPA